MRYIMIIVFFVSITNVVFGTSPKVRTVDSEELELRDSIVDYAQNFLGTPYKWGGTSTSGFDCTGFVYYVFKKFGVKVSRASSGYENAGEKVDFENSKAGDIMLFTGTNSSIRKVGHAGIVLKNTDGMIDFIHSSSSKRHFGVTITRYNESGYEKRFLRIINVL
ncbi:MAG: cell wall-associated NlpC family hydrolase [Arenicella sp.]|jgi:cell wall-associated NlpC family hydrolase